MIKYNELLKKHELKPYRYSTTGKVTIVETAVGNFVIKEKNKNNEIIDYLRTRNFNYMPEVLDKDENFELTPYISEINYPEEQKIADLINLVSTLHLKTNHYKEVDYDSYKEIYEDINNNIEYLYSYYLDHLTLIESQTFMSPSQYLFARNFSKILSSLNYCKYEITTWYELVKEKTKKRQVVLHNNLELSHYIKNENEYLISWDKAKYGIPIFDLYILYKKYGLKFDFSELLKLYEKNYPLQLDERKLLFVLIALPPKIEFNQNEYNLTKEISKMIDINCKTENLISPYNSEQKI